MERQANPVAAPDWSTIPAPHDDGAALHLAGRKLASIRLHATDGSTVDLSALQGRTVVYIYPRTGRPDVPTPDGWNAIPGARGCSPQSCGFRDHFAELKALGVSHVFGISTQDTAYQTEAVSRLELPFPLLSDADGRFADGLVLPSFSFEGTRLLKRMALVIDGGTITHVFYPVFPPDQNAEVVVNWLTASAALGKH